MQQKSHYDFAKPLPNKRPQINRRIISKKMPRIETIVMNAKDNHGNNVILEKTLKFNGEILNVQISLTRSSLTI